MFQEKIRKMAAGVCLATAILLLCGIVLRETVFPLPDRYAATHTAAPVKPLKGFGADSVFNVGDAKTLDAFPGIGEVLSQRIIEGRDILGDYFLPTDLLLVKGIGPKTLAGIMDVLTEPLLPREE